ncbi:MAG: dihydrofolate reductase [Bacteroidales bacterium]
MQLSIIVAIGDDQSIGKDNDLLWRLPGDLKRFKSITMGHPIIMGRRTFESLPKGALPGRKNIVLSQNRELKLEEAIVCHSVQEAVEEASSDKQAFVIGGGTVYETFLPLANQLLVTHVHHQFPDADTFFPRINPDEWIECERETHLSDESNPYAYTFSLYKRK